MWDLLVDTRHWRTLSSFWFWCNNVSFKNQRIANKIFSNSKPLEKQLRQVWSKNEHIFYSSQKRTCKYDNFSIFFKHNLIKYTYSHCYPNKMLGVKGPTNLCRPKYLRLKIWCKQTVSGWFHEKIST